MCYSSVARCWQTDATGIVQTLAIVNIHMAACMHVVVRTWTLVIEKTVVDAHMLNTPGFAARHFASTRQAGTADLGIRFQQQCEGY